MRFTLFSIIAVAILAAAVNAVYDGRDRGYNAGSRDCKVCHEYYWYCYVKCSGQTDLRRPDAKCRAVCKARAEGTYSHCTKFNCKLSTGHWGEDLWHKNGDKTRVD
ncbi:hypothetical protein G6011_00157 [Alternaria panax]|uniref:Uncharacterized protein n=1 Tax=Alternaria panax TaxID=48097 RepID=A0AAD4NUG3_9PLEO|nr:hypothetical protein G6011_00157 [Alternaria panax]